MTRRNGWITAGVISVVGASLVAAQLMGTVRLNAVAMSIGVQHDSVRAGPDSARIVSFLTAMRTGDPLVCELLSDQVGNFWYDGADDGIGRFTDERKVLKAAKDSVHGRVSGTGAIAALEDALDSSDPCVRRVAAKWLGRSAIGNPRLIQLLEGNSPRVREAAAYAIGESDRERRMSTRSALEKMLQSATGTDGAMAAWALGELRDSASAPALEAALKSRELGVRLAAIQALGEIKQPRSLKVLERLLRSDSHEAARARVARAVGEFEDSSSMTVLAEALSDPSLLVQYAAIEAMEDLDDIEVASAALVKASRSADARLQELAVLALARIHDPRTLEVLLSHVGHANREVRLRVAEALGEIKSPKASPGLLKLLRDPDAEVRKAAVEALGEIEQ